MNAAPAPDALKVTVAKLKMEKGDILVITSDRPPEYWEPVIDWFNAEEIPALFVLSGTEIKTIRSNRIDRLEMFAKCVPGGEGAWKRAVEKFPETEVEP